MPSNTMTTPTAVGTFSTLAPGELKYALVANVDLVIVRWAEGDDVSVLYGRCQHRGALMADGFVRGEDIICGVHDWDYQYKTGVSSYDPDEKLHRFDSVIENDQILVDEQQIIDWEKDNPQPYQRDDYLGLFADHTGAKEEPYNKVISELAKHGLSRTGHHGPVSAMGVPLTELPRWQDLQVVTAQLARRPLLDDVAVATDTVIGPRADKPLALKIPLFVSDMSFGALSEEAKVALSTGAELAGTGICSGEGGMLPDEQGANSRYFYELASARFGFEMPLLSKVQAFHFKFGQGAKTGTGGHLPGDKVKGKIAEVRGLEPGTPAVSPATFPDLKSVDDYREFAQAVRKHTGGIPVGAKLSAQSIEQDIDAALDIGVDYIILDGRGGGTGAAPLIFRDNISVPTIPALARARRHLDARGCSDVTLVITGGLRTPDDFLKALALGADAVAVSNSALQAIGCLGMRACHTNNCPVGIATQKDHLRRRLVIDTSAHRLARFFEASVELMQVMARACGHDHLNQFDTNDLVAWKREMSELSGVRFAGVGAPG